MVSNRFERLVLLVLVIGPLVATAYAMVSLWNSWFVYEDLALLVGGFTITLLGITIGFHRMLTHRSFEAHPVLRVLLLIAGSMALQGPAAEWASVHIKHHAHADDEDDPHSPLKSFFHAHTGWFMGGYPADLQTYGSWMLKDRLIMGVTKTFLLWVALSFIIPFAIGGWSGLLWGGLVRVFLNHHITWSVNSICHTYGNRMFDTQDASRNNWLIGLLAMGEGWHNNHHAFPRSAFHGMRWYQIDISSYIIWMLERVGLVWNVQRIPEERIQARLAREAQ